MSFAQAQFEHRSSVEWSTVDTLVVGNLLLILLVGLALSFGPSRSPVREWAGNTPSSQVVLELAPASVQSTGVDGGLSNGSSSCDATCRREKADLVAQQRMSDSADRMVGLTIVQILIAILGTAGLLVTLRLTVESNAIARNVGIAQTRAYITDSGFKVGLVQNSSTIVGINFQPTLKNTGPTPAKCVNVVSRRELRVPSDGDMVEARISAAPAETPYDIGGGNGWDMIPIGLDEQMVSDIAAGRLRCFLLGYAEYMDVFYPQTPMRLHTFCYEVHFVGPLSGIHAGQPIVSDYWHFNAHSRFKILIETPPAPRGA